MLARLRSLIFNRNVWQTIEVAIIGLFFIQGLRQFVGDLYRQSASASLISAYPAGAISPDVPGYTTPGVLQGDIVLMGLFIALPIVATLYTRWRWSALGLVILIVIGRLGINTPLILSELGTSGLVIGASFAYLVWLVRWRASKFPYFFVLGLGIEQLLRAAGNTIDPTLSNGNASTILILGGMLTLLAFINLQRDELRDQDRGLLTFWGAVGMGALLFLQLSLLSMPNAIAGRADADYTLLVPLTLFATLATMMPVVRLQARRLIAPFDNTTRGWLWFISIAFFVIVGTRLQRLGIAGLGSFPIGGLALVIAQLGATLLWWYFVRPRGETERQLSGLWILGTLLVFASLTIGDIFTYEYAFVRDFAPPLASLNAFIPPLLRGFRGMGLGLLLITVLLATMPMIQASNRIPWVRGSANSGLMGLLVVVATIMGVIFARPPLVNAEIGISEMRVGTYNIHGGYSEFFDYNLEGIARAISQSGASVVMLQEVDGGRLTSYGVDQSLWLARRLGMDRRVYPTIEGLRGLAVLSKVPIVFDDGVLLDSIDQQTGLQRVQVLPADRPITLYNTKLGLLLAGDSIEEQERNQRQQLNQILSTIDTHIERDYGGRVENVLMVLGGTFHNVPDSPLLQTLEQTGFSDPFAGSNPTLSDTLVRNDRQGRIDYVWVWRQGLRWTGNGVINSDASDHRLAFVNIIFGRP